jgi:hypothetical protein
MTFINPVADLIFGAAIGFALYFTVTDSWWTVPYLLKRLFD